MSKEYSFYTTLLTKKNVDRLMSILLDNDLTVKSIGTDLYIESENCIGICLHTCMDNRQHFYRNDVHCLIAQDPTNENWMGFIGFRPCHPFHGSVFQNIKTIGLHKLPIADTMSHSVHKDLWWMGFSTNPYSKDRAMDLLKLAADEVGIPYKGRDED